MLGWIGLSVAAAGAAGVLFVQLRAARTRADELARRSAEVESQLKQQQASQAQIIHTTKMASLGQMVAGVAHEMNTPLGFVSSNVEVVGELLDEYRARVLEALQAVDFVVAVGDADDPALRANALAQLQRCRATLLAEQALDDAKALLADASDGLRQLRDLVLNLKGFARVDRDGMDEVDLDECLDSALVIAAHQLRHGIELERVRGELPKVRCMPSQMNQVFLNLLTNAAQAMPDGGRLMIRSRRAGSHVEIDIEDSGEGIPDEVLPRIFDPFFTTKPVGEGTGLGLSIVHKIVQGHGGAIKVRTAPGTGTCFTVSLPCSADSADAP